MKSDATKKIYLEITPLFDTDEVHLEVLSGTSPLSAQQKEIFKYIHKHKSVSGQAIMQHFNLDEAQFEIILKNMAALGIIRKVREPTDEQKKAIMIQDKWEEIHYLERENQDAQQKIIRNRVIIENLNVQIYDLSDGKEGGRQ